MATHDQDDPDQTLAPRRPVEPEEWVYDEDLTQVLRAAESIRREVGWPSIGTDHLALALLAESKRLAGELREAGVDLDALRDEIRALCLSGYGRDGPQFTPNVQNVLAQARAEVHTLPSHSTFQSLGDRVIRISIAPEHVMLALLNERRIISTQVLRDFGVTYPTFLRRLQRKDTPPPHRAFAVTEAGGHDISTSFEGVETYLERALADDRRNVGTAA